MWCLQVPLGFFGSCLLLRLPFTTFETRQPQPSTIYLCLSIYLARCPWGLRFPTLCLQGYSVVTPPLFLPTGLTPFFLLTSWLPLRPSSCWTHLCLNLTVYLVFGRPVDMLAKLSLILRQRSDWKKAETSSLPLAPPPHFELYLHSGPMFITWSEFPHNRDLLTSAALLAFLAMLFLSEFTPPSVFISLVPLCSRAPRSVQSTFKELKRVPIT